MSKRDDVNILYNVSKDIEKWCTILFWGNVLFSLGVALINFGIQDLLILAQILGAFLYIVLKSIDDGVFWYNAEKARRKNNIQMAFDVTLGEQETEGYYNNSIKPSIKKYAVNTLESNFFSKHLAGQMLIKSAFKSTLSIVMMIMVGWFVASQEILLIIVQAAFSVYVIEDTVMLAIYKFQMDRLYDEAFTELITIGLENKKQDVWMLSYVVEYETVKAHYKVRLDSMLFNKYNSELSKRWETIETKISAKNNKDV